MKLAGLKVVDLSVFLPGPYLTLALADHGAEVIKIESPDGDPGRRIGLSDGESTVFFRNLNRGKKSVVLNLKNPADREQLLVLCDEADVFVESFRPGVVQRLGVDYETLRVRNPRIVYCSISAYGQTGPYRDRPAHDLAVEAVSGMLSMTLGSDGQPAIPGIPVADIACGLQGLAGVLMALLRRQESGQGDYLDVAMHDSMVAATPNVLGPVFAQRRQPVPAHERTTGGAAFYRVYRTSDGRHLVLAGQEEKFVRVLLTSFGRPDLASLAAQGPGPHQQPLVDFLQDVFLRKSLQEWKNELGKLDICFGPVNTLPEAMEDPNALARSMVFRDEAGRQHLNTPIRFLNEPASPVLHVPGLGEHSIEFTAAAGAAIRRSRAQRPHDPS